MVGNKNSFEGFNDGVIDFTSGALGAVALVYVGQPLDTVKVKMQTFPHLYKGMWNCMHNTYRTEGIRRGLYAGTVPALAANIAENSVLFAAYGACQRFMAYATGKSTVEELSILSNATAGFIAAFFSSFSLCPTELVKIKMQAAKELARCNPKVKRESGLRLTMKIFKEEGVRGLFRGLTPTMAREMPGYFVFFGGYEGTRYFLTPKGKTKDDCGPLITMLAGAVGGTFLWTAMFPTDVVKSRVQLGQMTGSLFNNLMSIIRSEGVTALYSGLLPTLLRTIPSTAALFLVYESSKSLLHRLAD